jgi:hypothetical protein
MMTTADQTEIDNFAALSDQWWDQKGPMAPLHAFTPVRIDYILQSIGRFFPMKTGAKTIIGWIENTRYWLWRWLACRTNGAAWRRSNRH